MAYDKVIDSAKLDSAMTATADAIRAKTGGSDTLPWDMDTGFASAVEAIEAGGDNSMWLTLITGKLTEFVCKDYAEKLTANFGRITPRVKLVDINVKSLEDYSLGTNTAVLILRYNGVVTLANSTVITRTWLWDMDGDPDLGGYIYVPEQYINSYKTATNWSAANNGSIHWVAIEGSEYE